MSFALSPQKPVPAVARISTEYLPLISVITLSYNQGQFIEKTIESVLGQDYPKIEHWVIDGGGADDTLTVLHRYEADPRFRWISEPDNGQPRASIRDLCARGAICLPGSTRMICLIQAL